ncbi:ABC transporter [Capsulimonas corticalis]|uniref:ABC transporter n=1 Tax=Capsulimonas corticalis TaxID=2219043 RepID=A0A402CZ37_9BACT|nr:ABC transporter ATP-binding protein [Capsulimonas corticalis]BDI29520.1 ABC transporter [Capsulimonas corticalis]
MAILEATHESEERRDEEPLVRLEADIDSAGSFGRRSLEVTKDQVRVLDHDGTLAFQMPISEIKTARNEPLVGGGRLEITAKTGEILPIISYSQSVAAQFSEAARGIEQLAKGEPLLISLKTEQTNCPKCGRLLPEKDGVCPACVNRGRTLLRIAGFLKPYRLQAAALTTCSILTTLANLIPPQIVGNLVNGIVNAHHTLAHLFQLMWIWGAVIVFGSLVQVVNGRLIAFLAANIAADLRSKLYRSIEYLQVSYFDKKQVGSIASRVTQDTDRVWGFLVDGLPFLVINSLMLLGVIGFLLQISLKLTLAIIAPIPMVMLISIIFWRPMSTMFTRVGQKWARFHTLLNESLSGIRVMKAFAQEDLEFDRFASRNKELRDAAVAADSRWSTIFGAMSLFTSIGTLICWSVGGPMVYRHEITLGDFIKVTAYLNLVYGPLQWFAQVNNWFSRAMAGAERIFEIMDMEKENYAKDNSTKHDIEGTVEFSNIRFGYDKSNPVLKNLSFTAKPGEMIGLVGKSGAGKSTTINLICRFYEPDAGTLMIDGIDYREMDLQDLRRQIGLVLQEPFLFNGTIAENIAYGKPGADFDDIIKAAKAANAHNFILAKPDGYDTMVGERGAKLSGGERQRISIARAILHDPRILILDEATSSVDVETEKQIQEAIGRLTAGRTTFAIAHRLSTLRNADRLIVLDKGEIAEIGTHAELMEKKGEFFKLVETQSQVTQIIGLAE